MDSVEPGQILAIGQCHALEQIDCCQRERSWWLGLDQLRHYILSE